MRVDLISQFSIWNMNIYDIFGCDVLFKKDRKYLIFENLIG